MNILILLSCIMVPPIPDTITLVQPDGTKFEAYLNQSGKISWYSDTKNFSMKRHSNKYWCYSLLSKDGFLIPLKLFVVTKCNPHTSGFRPGIIPSNLRKK